MCRYKSGYKQYKCEKCNNCTSRTQAAASARCFANEIQKIIDDSSKLNILSMSDNIQLYSYCTLFYHFILKKQCYIDAINSLYNKISPTQETIYYKYEIYNSEFVFFIVVSPHVHSLPSQ